MKELLIKHFRKTTATALSTALLGVGAWAQSVVPIGDCGLLNNGYGPFDYMNATHRAEKLPIVERAHFDIGVRSLEGHLPSLVGNIDYTLRAFPNHHGALYAMVQYSLRGYNDKAPFRYTPECWFDRAKRMNPSDGNVWLIEGVYEAQLGNDEDAEKSYKSAIELMPNAPEPHYNLGLLYLNAKNYSSAREHAQRAYELGYLLPGLKTKLAQLGEWKE